MSLAQFSNKINIVSFIASFGKDKIQRQSAGFWILFDKQISLTKEKSRKNVCSSTFFLNLMTLSLFYIHSILVNFDEKATNTDMPLWIALI